jgi:large subunit ribosomal protein L19
MNRQELLHYVDKKYQKKEPQPFKVGDTVRVSVRITEGDTTRIQPFEGTVIATQGHGGGRTFTVRKISFGVGVERCFPLFSPLIDKIEIIRSGHVRRAKLYYLRERVGRSARLEEKESGGTDLKKLGETNPGSSPPPVQELAIAKEK